MGNYKLRLYAILRAATAAFIWLGLAFFIAVIKQLVDPTVQHDFNAILKHFLDDIHHFLIIIIILVDLTIELFIVENGDKNKKSRMFSASLSTRVLAASVIVFMIFTVVYLLVQNNSAAHKASGIKTIFENYPTLLFTPLITLFYIKFYPYYRQILNDYYENYKKTEIPLVQFSETNHTKKG